MPVLSGTVSAALGPDGNQFLNAPRRVGRVAANGEATLVLRGTRITHEESGWDTMAQQSLLSEGSFG